MRKFIAGIAAAAFVLATGGCLHTKIEGQGWKMNRWQFFERQEIGTIDVATNGVLHVGAYVTGVDTNGLAEVANIAAAVTAAAVKAGILGTAAMQQNALTDAPVGRTVRVHSVNGEAGPYDLQFVPVAREPNEDMK